MKLFIVVTLISLMCLSAVGVGQTFTVSSPDNTIQIKIEAEGDLSYSVTMDGATVVLPSKLQIILQNGLLLGNNVTVLSKSTKTVRDSWQAVTGPRKFIADHYNQILLDLKEKQTPAMTFGFECRVYDDGIAFRYIHPRTCDSQEIQIREEFSEFNFQDDYTCWPAFLNKYTTEHQALYPLSKLSNIQTDSIVGVPLTIQLDQGRYCSITEAGLDDGSGMYVTNAGMTELFSTGEVRGGQAGVDVSAELVAGTNILRIVIDSLGDINYDHVDLADAKLVKSNGETVWLSDLDPVFFEQDWSSPQKDQSIDRNTLTIAGQSYPKGVGSHANAEMIYELPSEFARFEAVVGIDSEVGNNGSANVHLFSGISERYNHSVMLFSSGQLNGGQAGVTIAKELPAGTNQLRFIADSLGDLYCDHVDFADAKLMKANGDVVWLSDLTPTFTRQDWGSLHVDQSVDGNALTIGGQAYSKGLGTHANAEVIYNFDPEYVRFEAVVGIDSEVGQNGEARAIVYSTAVDQSQYSLRSTLSRLDGQTIAVESPTPHRFPWRVIMLGRRPSDLLNSDIVVNLNEPSKIADTSWIKPGMSSWNWLSSGSEMDMDLLKSFVDLSATMEWEYALIDDGWYKNGNCTTPQDYLDIPALVSYAAARNVKLWLWVHWQALDARMEQAFSVYENWGIAGVKIDFMSRDDQWMVNWYQTVLASAASHQLMINFHGCYKPTGIRRTWPNLMTREAVYGNEQNLGSRLNDPVHKTTLPFTRMLAGPMDYTPGSFLNETQTSWSGDRPIESQGTRCQEMALCLIYDSPIVSMADKPDNYYGQDGLEFLKGLPASWDDTKVLDGQIGQFLLSARQKNKTWYLGAMTNWDTRTINVPLDFLEANCTYNVVLYEDGPEAFSTNARDVNRRELQVSSQSSLSVNLASGGGFVAILQKMN